MHKGHTDKHTNLPRDSNDLLMKTILKSVEYFSRYAYIQKRDVIEVLIGISNFFVNNIIAHVSMLLGNNV